MTLPPKLTVGTMNFGKRTPEPEAIRIVHAALERGGAFFDTANVYGDGESERILGRALKGRRGEARLATKVGLLRRGGATEGLAKARIPEALSESLERLQTDHVDLYYLHAPDPRTPLGETLDALCPLLESKRIRSWGVSNFASWQIRDLQLLAAERGMPPPAVSQVLYNLLIRQLDLEYFAFAKAHPIHTTVYNPLAGGLLARLPSPGEAPAPGSRLDSNKLYRARYGSEGMAALALRYAQLAREEGLSPVTLAYAWLAEHPGVDSILAGPASLPQLEAAFEGASGKLSAPMRSRIEELHRSFLGTDARYAR